MSEHKLIINQKGPFTKKDLLDLHNQVVDMFNKGKLVTYMCSVFYKNGKRIDKWVNIPRGNAENVIRVAVWECEQKPVFIN